MTITVMTECMKRATAVPLGTMLVLCLTAAGAQSNNLKMPSQSPEQITAPNPEDQRRLRDQRAVVEKYLADETSRQKYQTAAGKLGLIRAVLSANVFMPTQTYELQCLGTVLGDAFVQELKMEWILVEDGSGRDPAVRLPGTSIILYPLTMISKRIERGDKVDVFDLFNGVAAKVDEMKNPGDYR
jgi:hypothetical protein